MIKDPIQEYVDWLKEMAVTLNTNLEGVKAWMSAQYLQNEMFLEGLEELKAEIKSLKKEVDSLKEAKEAPPK